MQILPDDWQDALKSLPGHGEKDPWKKEPLHCCQGLFEVGKATLLKVGRKVPLTSKSPILTGLSGCGAYQEYGSLLSIWQTIIRCRILPKESTNRYRSGCRAQEAGRQDAKQRKEG
jgi:hypothetical protein